MSTTKEFRDYILEHIQSISSVICRPMMGEYLLYISGKLIGGIYDNRLLIKQTVNNSTLGLKESIPYKNAKPMYLIEDIENHQKLADIIIKTYKDIT